jgi:predicted permease
LDKENMGSFLFALNAVLPIILMVAIGYVIKKIGLVDKDIAKTLNKLVFRLFLPVMIFLNIYNIEDFNGINVTFVAYAMIAVLVIFAISIPVAMLITRDPAKRGAMLQSAFRSNYTLIGIPLAEALFPGEGVIVATVLLAVAVPLFNVLAVVSLSIFGDGRERVNFKKILVGIIKNPLIQAVAVGTVMIALRMFLASRGISFDLSDIAPIYKVLNYLSALATPIALIVLGIQFEFSSVSELGREIFWGTLIRAVLVPALAIGTAYVLFRDRLGGAHFAAFVALFATPVAVSSVPMAQEMGADTKLAGQLVVWTTVASAFTIFLISFALSMLGIFPKI